MKLASVYFDDIVVIPGGKDNGSGEGLQPLRESSFHAADGWDISMDERSARGGVPGVFFRLHREGMPAPVFVGGYGFSYVAGCSPVTEGGAERVATLPAEPLTTAPPVAVPDTGTSSASKRRRR